MSNTNTAAINAFRKEVKEIVSSKVGAENLPKAYSAKLAKILFLGKGRHLGAEWVAEALIENYSFFVAGKDCTGAVYTAAQHKASGFKVL